MRSPSLWFILLCGFFVCLSGCQSPAPAPSAFTPLPQQARERRKALSSPSPATIPVADRRSRPHFSLPSNQVWVAYSRWCRRQGLSPLRTNGTEDSFQQATPAGTLELTAGSQRAKWRGVYCWLGFPPRYAEGQLWVNSLDIRKELLPLLEPAPTPLAPHRIVVIDPGHGGANTGAKDVVSHRYEKEYTLDWALRLRPLLAREGWSVYLTRTNDVNLTLAERVEVAQRRHADLFVSLHFNSSPHPTQGGVETYCLTPAGMTSHLVRGAPEDVNEVLPNNDFDAANLRWAFRLQRALVAATGWPDRGIRRARFMGVLRTQSQPAVLLEGGFLSVPEEASAIDHPAQRQALAQAVADGLNLW